MNITKLTQNPYFKKTIIPQLIAGVTVLGGYGIYKCATATTTSPIQPEKNINTYTELIEYRQAQNAEQNKILHKLEKVAQPTMTQEEFLEELRNHQH